MRENAFAICAATRADMHCGHSHFCLACKGKVEQGARCQSFTKGNPVNKSQLIDALAARYEGNKKAAAHALESVLDTITREVAKGEKVAITGFGSFEKRVREARWVRNPATGARMKSKRTTVPRFSAGAELKAVVSGAKKLPAAAVASAPVAAVSRTAAAAKKTATKSASAAKKAAKKAPAKKAAAKKAPAKKAAKKTVAKKSTAKKTVAKKAPAKKAAAKKAPAKKAAAKKAPAKKAAKKTARKR
jgi:DNA-binding protein HU-beta